MEEEEKETEKKEVDEKNKAVEAGDEARTDRGQSSLRPGETKARAGDETKTERGKGR